MKSYLLVISLKRTPERLSTFEKINKHTLLDWEVDVIDGIDGEQEEQIIMRRRCADYVQTAP